MTTTGESWPLARIKAPAVSIEILIRGLAVTGLVSLQKGTNPIVSWWQLS